MTTTITKTVGPGGTGGGYNYGSLSAFEAGEQGTLIANDQLKQAICYAFDDNTAVTFAGSTTDFGRRFDVICAAGNGHNGIYDATKYRLTSNSSCNIGNVVSFTGIQWKRATASAIAFNVNVTGQGIILSKCIIDTATGLASLTTTCYAYISQTIAYNLTGGVTNNATAYYDCQLNCCTVITSGVCVTLDRAGTAGATVFTDNYLSGSTCFAVTGASTRTANATSDNTGSSGLQFISVTAAKFRDSSLGNYNLAATSPLIGTGVDNSASVGTTDIAGNTRPNGGTWDIGAWEYYAATVVTKTVGSQTPLYNYLSLSSWEAGEQADLAGPNIAKVVECYAITDTTPFIIGGWVSTFDNYIKITCNAAARHSGVWDTAKYNLSVSGGAAITVSQSYVTIEYIQLEVATENYGINQNGTLTGLVLRNVLARSTAIGTSSQVIYAGGDSEIYNCIFYKLIGNDGYYTVTVAGGGRGSTIVNSTIIGGSIPLQSSGGTTLFINSYAGGGTDTVSLTGSAITCTQSAVSTTAIAGAISVPCNNTTFISTTGYDFHIGTPSSLLLNACNKDTRVPLDIDGDTRATLTEIGADKYIPPPVLVLKTVKASGGNYLNLTDWEAGEQCDLSALNVYKQVDVYGGSSQAGGVVVDGWANPDVKRYITINVPASERHRGIYDNTKALLIGSGSLATLTIGVAYTQVIGMQFSHTGDGRSLYFLANNCLADGIIATTAFGNTYSIIVASTGTLTIKNSLIYRNTTHNTGETLRLDGSSLVLNCTIIGGAAGINNSSGTCTLVNSYVGGITGNTTSLSGSNYVVTSCRTHDGYAGTSVVLCSNVTFIAVNSNYHISYSGLLKGATTVDSRAPTDIDGEARSNPSDIGADFWSAPAFQVITKSIKASGSVPAGNYTSMSSWESDRQGNLLDRNTAEVAEGYDGLGDFGFMIDGWVTSPTNYIICKAAAGNGHRGIIDKSKYYLNSNSMIRIRAANTTINRMQIIANDTAAYGILIDTPTNSYDIVIDACILDGAGANPSDAGVYFGNDFATAAKLKVQNCIMYNYNRGVLCSVAGTAGSINILGCTLIADNAVVTYDVGGGNIHIESTYGRLYNILGGTNIGASKNNAGTVLANVPGTNPIQVTEDVATFRKPPLDWHIVPYSPLLARSTTLGLTTDIDGENRGLTFVYDTGADQYSGNEPKPPNNSIFVHPTRAIALGQV